jgi:anti-anti-sigma factor
VAVGYATALAPWGPPRAVRVTARPAQKRYGGGVENSSDNSLDIAIDGADGGQMVVMVGGEVDPYTAPQLETALEKAVAEGAHARVVVDLGRVGFLDSSGLRVLISAHQNLKSTGRTLVLRNLNKTTRQLFEITQLVDEMTIE